MKSLDIWLSEYNQSHQNATNKLIHWLCVPTILFSIIGISWLFSIPVTLALIALVSFFYFKLSIKLGLAMLVVLGLMIAVVALLPWGYRVYGSIFVLAWIGQFYGHHIEGKKPSFFKDLQFLAVGPAWCVDHFKKRFFSFSW